MEDSKAIQHIIDIKHYWHENKKKFSCGDIEWCDDHKSLQTLLNNYRVYPVLRNTKTKHVISYMNEFGYEMNTNGIPSHPLRDVMGCWSML